MVMGSFSNHIAGIGKSLPRLVPGFPFENFHPLCGGTADLTGEELREVDAVIKAAQVCRVGDREVVLEISLGFGQSELQDIILNTHVHFCFEQS